MAAHRYWRVYVTATVSTYWCQIWESEFRGVVGGSDLTGAGNGTPFTGNNAGDTANIFDNNTATGSTINGYSTFPCWYGWDFGAGNAQDIAEFTITTDASYDRAPRDFQFQWSDDNSTWTTVRSYSGVTWTANQTQVFAVLSHRYWRLLFDENESGAGNILISEVEMRESRGGSDVCTGGTASVSSTSGGTGASCFDNNTSTYWASNGFGKGTEYLAYDFGAGQERNIVEVAITSYSSSTLYSPTRFRVQYSDDGSTWITAWRAVKPTSSDDLWGTTQTRVFQKPTQTELTAAYRYWRLVINNNGQNNRTGTTTIAEVALRATVGGADLTTPGGPATASSGSGSTGPIYAIDNSGSTTWTSTATYWPRWWQYDLASSPTAVQSFDVTAHTQVGTNEPTVLDLVASNDGTTWVYIAGYEGLTWTAGETKTFDGALAVLVRSRTATADLAIFTSNSLSGLADAFIASGSLLTATADFFVWVEPFFATADAYIKALGTPLVATADMAIVLPRAGEATPVDTVFIEHIDGSVEALQVVQGSDLKHLILGSAPRLAIQPGAPFTVVRAISSRREKACLVTERSAKQRMVSGLKAINYDRRYYYNDQDYKLGYFVDGDQYYPQHRFWRINITASNTTGWVNVKEMEYHSTPGGPNIVGSGIATASTEYSINWGAEEAFDGRLDTAWSNNYDIFPAILTYDFLYPVPVAEITLMTTGNYERGPRDFTLECSDDGLDWTVIKSFTGQLYSSEDDVKVYGTL